MIGYPFSTNNLQRIILILALLSSSTVFAQSPYYFNSTYPYLFPFPGATEINPRTNLIINSKNAFETHLKRDTFTVEDAQGQPIMGSLLFKENNHTLIFVPDHPLPVGERITVNFQPNQVFQKGKHENIAYCFYTTQQEIVPDSPSEITPWLATAGEQTPMVNPDELSLPDGYPYYEMGFQSNPTPNQYFFQASQVGQFYQLITDNNGIPYFYRETPSRCLDFKVNQNGYITYFDASYQCFVEVDSAYRFRRIYRASVGLETDNHELIVTPDGHYWTIGIQYVLTDMSQYVDCGSNHAEVKQYVIEEKDADNVVLWQWRTFDHFNIMDGDTNQVNFCDDVVNYAHVNSIALDQDGNVLISSRKLNEITKIDKETGNILWRLGGIENQFSIIDDPLEGFTDQHMAREDQPGIVTVFDNGNFHQPPHSRGVSYAIDTVAMTATYLQAYDDNDPVVETNPMGSMQTLDNGNVVVGWTLNPQNMCLTEYDPQGNKVLEMHQSSTNTLRSYRSLKYPWKTTYFYPENDTLDFGFQVLSGTTVMQSTNIVNPNDDDILVTGSYTSSGLFHVETPIPFTIPAHASQEVTLGFHPIFQGDYQGYAYLMTQNDSTGIALKINLKGSTLLSGIHGRTPDEVTLYPNPFAEKITLSNPTFQSVQVIIYSGSGKEMHRIILVPNASRIIRTSDWSTGLYMVKFRSGEHVWHQKVVKL